MKDIVQYKDFSKLDIRVGQINRAEIPDWSNKLIKLTVNFGSVIGDKIILAGIKKWYQPEDLENKKFLFVVNLAEKKMGPEVSQGMMLMICPEDEQPHLIPVAQSEIEPGSKIC